MAEKIKFECVEDKKANVHSLSCHVKDASSNVVFGAINQIRSDISDPKTESSSTSREMSHRFGNPPIPVPQIMTAYYDHVAQFHPSFKEDVTKALPSKKKDDVTEITDADIDKLASLSAKMAQKLAKAFDVAFDDDF